jgi:hypothetical protein
MGVKGLLKVQDRCVMFKGNWILLSVVMMYTSKVVHCIAVYDIVKWKHEHSSLANIKFSIVGTQEVAWCSFHIIFPNWHWKSHTFFIPRESFGWHFENHLHHLSSKISFIIRVIVSCVNVDWKYLTLILNCSVVIRYP